MPNRKGGPRTVSSKASTKAVTKAPTRPVATAMSKSASKATGKAAPARKSPAKKKVAKKSLARKSVARKSVAKKSPVKGAQKSSPRSAVKAAVKKGVKTSPARTGSAAKRVVKKTAARRAAVKPATSRPATRLERDRRLLDDETLFTPPSSLDMNRQGSAARTGRDELAEARADHSSFTPDIAAGDVDVDVEDAYFTGDEAPGGDNPTPDQDVVDEIGKALGVEYEDNEELRASDKVADRDKSRWELDPASAEDYRDRDKE